MAMTPEQIDPPKPTRVRFEIDGKGGAYSAASDVEENVYANSSIDYTHEVNIDDCYTPGEDFCSIKEMADAGVCICWREDSGEYDVWTRLINHCPSWSWTDAHPDMQRARRAASALVRKRQGRSE